MAIEPVRIGIVGCGVISEVYLSAMKQFGILEVVACSDIDIEKARLRAKQFDIPKAYTFDEMLDDKAIEIVLNLTIPSVHAQISIAALKAGKSVYSEKPLAVTCKDARNILEIAKQKNLRVGCAPDTFLGGGLQTCRKIIDEGIIGEPIAANAILKDIAPDSWHPNPSFYFQPGAGPLFELGVYTVTAFVNLLGPVQRVASSVKTTFPQRTTNTEPNRGDKIQVNTPTHITGIMDFAEGAVGTIVASYDVWTGPMPQFSFELHGTEGTLILPDPNRFGGTIRLCRGKQSEAHKYIENRPIKEWEDVDLEYGYSDESRGIGLADMAYALRTDREHRANGENAYHVLEIMHALIDTSGRNEYIRLNGSFARPALIPQGLPDGISDELVSCPKS